MADTSVVFNILAKDNASGAMDKIGKAAVGMFSAFAAMGALDFAKGAIESASNLAETQSKVQQLFGSSTAAVNQFAAAADRGLGQSKQQALDAASTFAVFGQSAGLTGDKLVGFSTQMTTLASDLASFHNTTPQQAIEAIGAAMRGEMEPIRSYGVLLDDASMRQQALKMGLISTTSQALTPQQKVLTAQALIMQQTSSAQGDFAKTSGGLANQQRIMAAEFENAKGKLGQGLLPIMLQFVHGLTTAIGFVQQNSGWVTPLAIGLGVLAAGIWIVTTAQTAWNIAMMMNPIGLVIIAVVALVAGILWLWFHSSAFRQFFIDMWQGIWGFLQAVGAWFAGPFVGFFVGAWNWIKNAASSAGDWIHSVWSNVINFFTGMPGRISAIASGMWDGIKNAFRGAINFIIRGWNSLHFSIPSLDVFGVHTPGFSFGVPSIPYLAKGGTVTSGGLAVVGEKGAEVVSLPTGASVYPHGSGGGTPTVMVSAGDEITEALFIAIRRKVRGSFGGDVQIALGGAG